MPAVQPVYRALVSIKVKLPDGRYDTLQYGDDIPPGVVEKWTNPGLWAKRGFIERKDGSPISNAKNAYVPPHASTDEDIERALTRSTGPSAPFPKAGEGAEIGPGKGQQSAAVTPSDAELDAAIDAHEKAPAAKPVDPKLLEELAARSRKELVALAEKQGMKVNGSESKAELAAALLKK